MRYLLISLSFCFCINNAAALTLNQALVKGYDNFEELKIIRSDFLTEIEAFPQALASFMPNVSLIGRIDQVRSSTKPAGGSFGATSKNNRQTRSLTLNQPIFNGWSSVSELKAAQSAFRRSRSDYYNKEQDAIIREIEIYLNCVSAKKRHEISKISVKSNQTQLDSSEERLKLGESTETDLAFAKSGVATAIAREAIAYAEYEAASASFYSAFGEEPVNIESPQIDYNSSVKTLDELIVKAMNQNLRLESARHAIKITKARENAAKGVLLPQVNFSLTASDTMNSNNPSVLSSARSRNREASAGFSVQVPILSKGGAEYSDIRRAKQAKRRSAVVLDLTIKQIRTECKSEFARFAAAKLAFEAREKAVESAEIAFEGATQEELLGSKTIVDVLEAEEKLSEARLAKVDAKKDLVIAYYRLKALTGNLTAKSMNLPVEYFEPEREFKRVKSKIIGF